MTDDGQENHTETNTSLATPDAQVRNLGLAHGTDVPDDGLVICRLDKIQAHHTFARDNPALKAVLITIEAARIFTEQGKTADSVFGEDVVVGVSTAIPDDQLEWWYPGREIEVVWKFAPDFYIPCDRPVYQWHSPWLRRDKIRRYLRDLREITERLQDRAVVIIPFVKGVTPDERQRCYQVFNDLGFDRWAYYCAQYFLYGNRGEELVTDVRAIVDESNLDYLMLVGLQAEQYLTRMPPAVQAAAGQRWITKSDLRNDRLTMNHIQSNFGRWAQYIENLLHGGQSALDQWGVRPGGIHGD